MSPTEPSTVGDAPDAETDETASPRVRGVIAGVAILATASQTGSTAVLAAAVAIAALAAAIVVRPALSHRWTFNVALAAGILVYGVAYALTVGGTAALVVGVALVALGALMAGNHLGVVPWSDHSRQI
ncbi:hypothetical protein [Halosimplex sp. J119]